MSSQPGAPDAPPPGGGGDESRLHISAITELPAGHDAELAIIFQEMRRAADISAQQMAGRLATTLETIQALETGALLALPPWPELTRIITAYATLLGLDSRPILRRLEGQLGENQPAGTPPPPAAPNPSIPVSARTSGPPMPPSAMPPPSPPKAAPPPPPRRSPLPQPPGATPPPSRPRPQPQRPPPPPPPPQAQPFASQAAPGPEEKPKGRIAGYLKPFLSWAVLFVFVASLGFGVWYAARYPRIVWSTLDTLPAPLPRLMRSAWNFMRPLDTKPARPQISDPDNRKSDKLP